MQLVVQEHLDRSIRIIEEKIDDVVLAALLDKSIEIFDIDMMCLRDFPDAVQILGRPRYHDGGDGHAADRSDDFSDILIF